MGGRGQVPNDPGRRERILEAALDVIAERGVSGTSHRRIAARAQVPLGSLTYYFSSLDELLRHSFDRLSRAMSLDYRASLERAGASEQAEQAVVDLICGPTTPDERQQALIFELYAYGNQHPETGLVATRWLQLSRDALMLHFSEPVARALDVLIEGWPIHRRFEGGSIDRAMVSAVVHAVVASGAGGSPTAQPDVGG